MIAQFSCGGCPENNGEFHPYFRLSSALKSSHRILSEGSRLKASTR
jgi:hypothetical protein